MPQHLCQRYPGSECVNQQLWRIVYKSSHFANHLNADDCPAADECLYMRSTHSYVIASDLVPGDIVFLVLFQEHSHEAQVFTLAKQIHTVE